MRYIATMAAAATLALGLSLPGEAEAASKARVAKAKATKTQAQRIARRPASVGSNGLCQRDTGTPTSQLSFRNRCDTEEFWERMNQTSPDSSP